MGTTRTHREQPDFLPTLRVMGIPLPYTVPESCGQTANLVAWYSARTVIFVESKFTEVGPDIADGHASAAQPACPPPDTGDCVDPGTGYMTSISPAPATNASPDGYLYDPYDPDYGSDMTSDCSGGGGGGETGGGSEPSFAEMCSSWGGKLYYDYGCIEQYDVATGQWEEIWCGTYATCET